MAYSPMYINPATSNFANDWQNAAQVSQMMQENAANSNPEWGYWNAVVGNAFNMASAMPEGYTRRDYNEERAIAARQLTWGPLISGGGIMANAALTAAMYGSVQGFLANTMPGSFTYSRIPLVGKIFRPTVFGGLLNPGLSVGSGILEGARLAENVAGFGTSFLGRNLGRGIGAATGGLIGGAAKTAAWGARLSAASLGFGAESTKWMTNWGVAGTLARWGGTAGGIVGGFAANFLNPVFLAKNYLLERGIEYAQDAYDELNTQADLQKEMIAKGSRILRYGFSDGSRGLRGGFTTRQRDRFSSFIENLARSDERVARMDAFHMGSGSVFGGHHQYVENLKELKSLFSVATDTGMLDLSKSLDDVEKKFSELAKIVKKLNRVTGKSKGELAAAMASIQQSEARFNMMDVGRALERRSYAAMATGAQLGTAMMEGQMGAQLGAQFGVGKAIGADMATQSRLVIGRMIRGGAIGREQLAAMGGEEGAITALTSGILGSMQDDTFMTEMAMSYNPNTGGFDDSRLNKYIGADAATLQRLHRERALALTTYSLNPFTGRMEAGGALKGLMPQVQYAMQTGQLSSSKALKWISNLTRQTIAMRGETFGRTSVINTLTERFGYVTAMQLAPVILNGEYMDATPGEQAEVARLNALQRYDREITGRGMTAGAIGMFGGLWNIATSGLPTGLIAAGGGLGLAGSVLGGIFAPMKTLPMIAKLSARMPIATSKIFSTLGGAIRGGIPGGIVGGVGLAATALYGLYQGYGLIGAAVGDRGWQAYYRNKYNQGRADAWRQLYGLSDFAYDMMSHGGEEAINYIYGDPEARISNFGVDINKVAGVVLDQHDRIKIQTDRFLAGNWRRYLPSADDTFLSKSDPEKYFASVARYIGKSWGDNSLSYKAGQMVTSALFTEVGSSIGQMIGSRFGFIGGKLGGLAGGFLTIGLDIYRYNQEYYKNNPRVAGTWGGLLDAMVNNPYFSSGTMTRLTMAPYLATGVPLAKAGWNAAVGIKDALKPILDTSLMWDPHTKTFAKIKDILALFESTGDYNALLEGLNFVDENSGRWVKAKNLAINRFNSFWEDKVVGRAKRFGNWTGDMWTRAGGYMDDVITAWKETQSFGEFLGKGKTWAGGLWDKYVVDYLDKLPGRIEASAANWTWGNAFKGGAGWLFQDFSRGSISKIYNRLGTGAAAKLFGRQLGSFASSWRGFGTGLVLDVSSALLHYAGNSWEDSDTGWVRDAGYVTNLLGDVASIGSYTLSGASIGSIAGPWGSLIGGAIGAGIGYYQAKNAGANRPSERWKREMRVGVLTGYSDVQKASLVEMYGSERASKMMKNHKLGAITKADMAQATQYLIENNLAKDEKQAAEIIAKNRKEYESDSWNSKLNTENEFITGEWKDIKSAAPIEDAAQAAGSTAVGGILGAWIGGAIGTLASPAGAVFGAKVGAVAGGSLGYWVGRWFRDDYGKAMDATRSLIMNNSSNKDVGIMVRLLSGKLNEDDINKLQAAAKASPGSKDRALLDSLTGLLTQAGGGQLNEDKIENAIVKIAGKFRNDTSYGKGKQASIAALLNEIDRGGIDSIRKVAEIAKTFTEGYNADLVISGINSLGLTATDAGELKDFLRGKTQSISSETLKKKLAGIGLSDVSGNYAKVQASALVQLAAEGQKKETGRYKNDLDEKLEDIGDDPQKTIAKTQVEIAKYLKEANLLMTRFAGMLGTTRGSGSSFGTGM